MKVGILTYHRSKNYGAYLQACALCNRLNMEEDIDAEIIDFHMKKEKDNYSLSSWSIYQRMRHIRNYMHKKTIEKVFNKAVEDSIMPKSKDYCCSDSLEDFKSFVYGKYDVIIAGSDEIWKLDGFRGFPTPYWLIGDLGCRKFSYAASSRSDFSILNAENMNLVKNALNDFEFISVRDKLTYASIASIIGSASNLILSCDPSFLFDFKKDDNFSIYDFLGSRIDKTKKNITVMCDDKTVLNFLLEKYGDNYNMISVHKRYRGYVNLSDLSPRDWMNIVAKTDLMISSFFHGICFSIVNNTSFLAVGTPMKSSKLENLLLGTSLEKYYVKSEQLKSYLKNNLEELMIKKDYSDFVETQRSGFAAFLKKLRDCDTESN